jgi:cytochrome b561
MTENAPSLAPIPPPKRYHPALVVLHWLVAVLIVLTAFLALGGGEGEGFRPGSLSIAGLPVISIHMILGLLILTLLVVRLVVRWRTRQPDWATTGSGFLDKVGIVTHWALYVFTFAITITGLILALQTNRLARIFSPAGSNGAFAFRQSQGGALPPSGQFQPGQIPPSGQYRPGGDRPGGFEGRFSREGGFFLGAFHGLSWTILLLLIILHVGAALYHQFLRRDGLLGRMWFGPRYA